MANVVTTVMAIAHVLVVAIGKPMSARNNLATV